jgi:predicted TIM-barrel fold metal-dependent hydrolase
LTSQSDGRAGRLDEAAGTAPPALVDSHVHFWDRRRLHYQWLDGASPALQRDFLPEDLAPELEQLTRVRPSGLVFVQADCRSDQGAAEVEWVHQLGRSGADVLAVVAYAPLHDGAECAPELERLVREAPLVAGIRRLLQDEPPGFVTDRSLVAGTQLLARHGLAMDLCVRQHQLGEVVELVDQCPDVLFVLDHLGKPRITAEDFEPWAAEMTRLAERPHVRCKLSGLMSEAPPDRRTTNALRPWLEHALDAFGAERCMFGSDWPVLTDVGGYHLWCETVLDAVAGLSEEQRGCVLSGTATATYDPVNRAARAKES